MDMVRILGQKQRPDAHRSAVVRTNTGSKLPVFALLMCTVGSGVAQTTTIQPTLLGRLTYTDNVDASELGGSDWVTEISPGVTMRRESGRLDGFLNANLRSLSYARDSDRNTTFLALSGRGEFEALTDLLFLDADARISRNNGSALRGRGTNDILDANKDNETRTFSLGPRLEFRPFGTSEGLLSYRHTWFNGSGDIESRKVGNLDGRLRDEQAFGRFGWGLEYQREDASYSNTTRADVMRERYEGVVYYSPAQHVRLSVGAGRESNDFGLGRERYTIKSAGAEWTVSQRTNVAALVEDRFFGTGYNFDFNHRQARSSWSLTASRDVSSSTNERPGAGDELLFRQFYDALGSISDPVQRASEARRLLEEQGNNAFRFVSNSYYLDESIRGGFSLVGRRSVFRLDLERSERGRLGAALPADMQDDFAAYDNVIDHSVTASVAHRLTPQSSGNVSLRYSESEGTGLNESETDRTQLSVGIRTRLGPSVSGGITYRYQRAEGTGDGADFTENAVTANLGIRF